RSGESDAVSRSKNRDLGTHVDAADQERGGRLRRTDRRSNDDQPGRGASGHGGNDLGFGGTDDCSTSAVERHRGSDRAETRTDDRYRVAGHARVRGKVENGNRAIEGTSDLKEVAGRIVDVLQGDPGGVDGADESARVIVLILPGESGVCGNGLEEQE